jgi:hypothetical protein
MIFFIKKDNIKKDNIKKDNIKKFNIKKFNKYMQFKQQQKNNNNFSPDLNNKKYLVIMACHCDTDIKLNTIKQNLHFFAFENTHKIIINTTGLEKNNNLSEICSRHNNTKYYEIENSSYYDFGKWLFILKNNINYNDYDYVVLTNDSFIIHNSINHFLNLMVKYNVELYGYNDSTQNNYHFQSYLFGLRKDVIQTFIENISNPKLTITCQNDVINNFELKMVNWFKTYKSFLKIGNFKLQNGHNIFFTNDELYLPLKKSGLLPFTKLKRII